MIEGRPNVVVVGVGHSGTTILTKMLGLLGWNTPQADNRYCEHVGMRGANRAALRTQRLPQPRLQRIMAQLKTQTPWVVKDPRLSVTLDLWVPGFTQIGLPTLCWIQKDLAAVKRSYLKRNEKIRGVAGNRWNGSRRGYTVDEQWELLTAQVGQWPGPVITIQYDQLAEVTSLFKPR